MTWDDFMDVVNRAGFAWRNLLGQDRDSAQSNSVYVGANGMWSALSGAALRTALGILPSVTNTLAADVTMTTPTTLYTGPSCAQGTVGTWFASGQITVAGVAGDTVIASLSDGTTVFASTVKFADANGLADFHLSATLATPAGNIRISAKDNTSAAAIKVNQSGLSKDSTLTVIRTA